MPRRFNNFSSSFQYLEDSAGAIAFFNAVRDEEGTTQAHADTHDYDSPYDIELGYGQYLSQETQDELEVDPLSSLTIDEAREVGREVLSNHGGSSAMGIFQITNQNLGYMEDEWWPWGFDPALTGDYGDQTFDSDMQDRMGYILLYKRGMTAFLNSDNTQADRETFLDDLELEWEGLEHDLDIQGTRAGWLNLLNDIHVEVNNAYEADNPDSARLERVMQAEQLYARAQMEAKANA